ncbi:hypothetical protein PMI32_03588 [Pseudomonas sp. GM60]|nr:hypothetical protein PMI32_03588 [Pseudomonas sp. GM60]
MGATGVQAPAITAICSPFAVRTFLIAALLLVPAVLYIGYYEALEDGDIETILFIKKHPTVQMKFYNIHANDGEIRRVERLTEEERKWIIDYCRYRLGIDTALKTQDDVEVCRKK